MAGRNYERLSIEKFGRHLLESGDLDPVYIALNELMKAEWDLAQVKRWCVAYWCLYHCGAASYLSTFEGTTFWLQLLEAARNEKPAPTGGRWSRGSERRHWRGKQAVASWEDLNHRYDKPEDMVNYIMTANNEFTRVADRVKEHRAFGPWIAFKVCDMMDRVFRHPVDFTEAAVFMFKDPVKAAEMVWREKQNIPDSMQIKDQKTRNEIIHQVVGYLESEFKGMTAPPLHDRPIELQEVETVLCKWKSHMNGHYPLNNDIDEIIEGCEGWGYAADDFRGAMPARM